MRLHQLEVTAFGPFADTASRRLRRALRRGAVPAHRGHRRRQDQRPRRGLLRALRRGARRPPERQAAALRPGRCRRRARRSSLELSLGGPPVPDRPLPRLGAAQEARHRHHHPAGLGPALRARRGRLAPALQPARRDRPPRHPPGRHEPHPVLPGRDAPAGPVPGLPPRPLRRAPPAAPAALPHQPVRGHRALAARPPPRAPPGVRPTPRASSPTWSAGSARPPTCPCPAEWDAHDLRQPAADGSLGRLVRRPPGRRGRRRGRGCHPHQPGDLRRAHRTRRARAGPAPRRGPGHPRRGTPRARPPGGRRRRPRAPRSSGWRRPGGRPACSRCTGWPSSRPAPASRWQTAAAPGPPRPPACSRTDPAAADRPRLERARHDARQAAATARALLPREAVLARVRAAAHGAQQRRTPSWATASRPSTVSSSRSPSRLAAARAGHAAALDAARQLVQARDRVSALQQQARAVRQLAALSGELVGARARSQRGRRPGPAPQGGLAPAAGGADQRHGSRDRRGPRGRRRLPRLRLGRAPPARGLPAGLPRRCRREGRPPAGRRRRGRPPRPRGAGPRPDHPDRRRPAAGRRRRCRHRRPGRRRPGRGRPSGRPGLPGAGARRRPGCPGGRPSAPWLPRGKPPWSRRPRPEPRSRPARRRPTASSPSSRPCSTAPPPTPWPACSSTRSGWPPPATLH